MMTTPVFLLVVAIATTLAEPIPPPGRSMMANERSDMDAEERGRGHGLHGRSDMEIPPPGRSMMANERSDMKAEERGRGHGLHGR